MEYQAVFKKRNGQIEVYSVGNHNRDKTFLGRFDVNEWAYEGDYIFRLCAKRITRQCGTDDLHIPLNVLREIADYGRSLRYPTIEEQERQIKLNR